MLPRKEPPEVQIGKISRNLCRSLSRRRGCGRVLEFSTRETRLSQVCHHCACFEKKHLSRRWHRCECGIGPVQRDLYSAYLARHVRDGALSTESAREGWCDSRIAVTGGGRKSQTNGEWQGPSCLLRLLAGVGAVPPGSPAVEREESGGVAERREPERPSSITDRTP